jgi:hypothetical protein
MQFGFCAVAYLPRPDRRGCRWDSTTEDFRVDLLPNNNRLVPVTRPVATTAPSHQVFTPVHKISVSANTAQNICTKPKTSRTIAQRSSRESDNT